MARNFIDIQEVARLLHVTPDELSDMRSRNEIHGYRDGNTWKFKVDEVRRVAGEREVEISEEVLSGDAPVPVETTDSGIDSELDELSDVGSSDNESILVSDSDTGPGAKSPSSTIIGKDDDAAAKEDRDLKLKGGSGSDLQITGEDSSPGNDLAAGSGSDVLAADSGVSKTDDDTGSDLRPVGSSDDLSLEVSPGSSDLVSDPLTHGGSDLLLGGDSEGSGSGSAVDLDAGNSDDLVLGSGAGSDVTLGTEDSGIALKSPSDTGLSLDEEPLTLGSGISDLESSASGTAEEIVSLDAELSDPDAATELKADDEFLLTPVEEDGGEDSDSGSQVIALDTDESYDEDAATMLGTEAEVSITEAEPGLAPVKLASSLGPIQAVDAPYPVWIVLMLTFIVCFMGLTGMMMMDLVRFLWSWDKPIQLNSSIMDFLTGIFGG